MQEEFFLLGGARAPKIDTFCYCQIYFMSEKADIFPLSQPTIGAHGGTGKSARQGV